jgi:hypothetical protein
MAMRLEDGGRDASDEPRSKKERGDERAVA